MTRRVVVIGAGMGGLTAALRLARAGFEVEVIEARDDVGGLASAVHAGGLAFDGGPYVLLDRPGLEWAFRAVGMDLDTSLTLRRLDPVYEVAVGETATVRVHADLEATVDGLERAWPGSGARYRRLVGRAARVYDRLTALRLRSSPGLADLVRSRAWREAPFLLRSLGSVLAASGLPGPVVDTLAIWTHVAGQRLGTAPSPLALVPALIHHAGAFYPAGGIAAIPRAIETAARAAGVGFRLGAQVRRIRVERGRASAVETAAGERLPADAIVSNASGVGTYLELLDGTPARLAARLAAQPLQSPGVCAYLSVRTARSLPYLRFRVPRPGEAARLFVVQAAAEPGVASEGREPARLLAPMDHGAAEAAGPAGQRRVLDRFLEEPWWREGLADACVVATRTPAGWASEYRLHRAGMNPVMTAAFMRAGRLAHRSPVPGLYLAGSATHPGQWLSFCAISGVLAADCLREDLG